MTARVPHMRPRLEVSGIVSGEPVTAADWQGLAGLANFGNGHGAMLIPWSAIGYQIASAATQTFHFYVAPKARAVERIWCVNLRSGTDGATADVTCGSASAVNVTPPRTRNARAGAFIFSEPLSAKTSTAADTTLTIKANGGAVRVESVAMYEQTRSQLALDTTDYGADLGTLGTRSPIYDGANVSLAGVIDGYDNLDARRAGLFHWSTPVAVPITITAGSYTALFDLSPPVLLPVPGTTSTTSTVTCAAYAKVDAGTGQVRFTADGAGGNVVLSITGTSFAWVTGSLAIDCEDLDVDDGRRSSRWESLTIEGNDNTATTLSIAAISVVRTTAPV